MTQLSAYSYKTIILVLGMLCVISTTNSLSTPSPQNIQKPHQTLQSTTSPNSLSHITFESMWYVEDQTVTVNGIDKVDNPGMAYLRYKIDFSDNLNYYSYPLITQVELDGISIKPSSATPENDYTPGILISLEPDYFTKTTGGPKPSLTTLQTNELASKTLKVPTSTIIQHFATPLSPSPLNPTTALTTPFVRFPNGVYTMLDDLKNNRNGIEDDVNGSNTPEIQMVEQNLDPKIGNKVNKNVHPQKNVENENEIINTTNLNTTNLNNYSETIINKNLNDFRTSNCHQSPYYLLFTIPITTLSYTTPFKLPVDYTITIGVEVPVLNPDKMIVYQREVRKFTGLIGDTDVPLNNNDSTIINDETSSRDGNNNINTLQNVATTTVDTPDTTNFNLQSSPTPTNDIIPDAKSFYLGYSSYRYPTIGSGTSTDTDEGLPDEIVSTITQKWGHLTSPATIAMSNRSKCLVQSYETQCSEFGSCSNLKYNNTSLVEANITTKDSHSYTVSISLNTTMWEQKVDKNGHIVAVVDQNERNGLIEGLGKALFTTPLRFVCVEYHADLPKIAVLDYRTNFSTIVDGVMNWDYREYIELMSEGEEKEEGSSDGDLDNEDQKDQKEEKDQKDQKDQIHARTTIFKAFPSYLQTQFYTIQAPFDDLISIPIATMVLESTDDGERDEELSNRSSSASSPFSQSTSLKSSTSHKPSLFYPQQTTPEPQVLAISHTQPSDTGLNWRYQCLDCPKDGSEKEKEDEEDVIGGLVWFLLIGIPLLTATILIILVIYFLCPGCFSSFRTGSQSQGYSSSSSSSSSSYTTTTTTTIVSSYKIQHDIDDEGTVN